MYKWPLFEIRIHSDLRWRLASCQLGEQYHGPPYCNGAIQNFGDNVLCHLAVGAVVVGAGGPVIEAEADEPQSNDCQKLDSQEGPNNHVDKAPCHLGVGAVIVGPGSPVAGTEAEAETVVDGAVLVADEPELNEGGQVLGWQEGLNGCKDEVPCHLSVGPVTVGAGGTVVGTVAGVAGAFRAPDEPEPNVGQIWDWKKQHGSLYSAHLELRNPEACEGKCRTMENGDRSLSSGNTKTRVKRLTSTPKGIAREGEGFRFMSIKFVPTGGYESCVLCR